MLSGAAGAYSGKIPFCAPMSRYRRGLLRQNPYLRPDIPVSTGLITAKSLSTPRCPGIDGAYYGKIPFCAPLVRDPRGLSWQNLLLRPAGTEIPGAYSDKISFCAPMVRYRRDLFWQNLFLHPDGSASTGRILTKSLSVPRWSKSQRV